MKVPYGSGFSILDARPSGSRSFQLGRTGAELLGVNKANSLAASTGRSVAAGAQQSAAATSFQAILAGLSPSVTQSEPFALSVESALQSTSTVGSSSISPSGADPSATVSSLTQSLAGLSSRVSAHSAFDSLTPSEISGNVPPIRYREFLTGQELASDLQDLRTQIETSLAASGVNSSELQGLLDQCSTQALQVQEKQVQLQTSLAKFHEYALKMEPVLMPPDPETLDATEIRTQLDSTVSTLVDQVLAIRTDVPSEETGHVPGVRIMAMKTADRLLSWIEKLRSTHSDLGAFPELDEIESKLTDKLQTISGTFGHLSFGNEALAQIQHLAASTAPVGETSDDFPAGTVFLHTDTSHWPVTSRLDHVTIADDGITFEHTKAGKWKATDTGVEGNLWIVVEVDGKPYAATVEWLRPGQTHKTFDASSLEELAAALGPYTKRPPLTHWAPHSGEKIGFFVSTPARAGVETGQMERSNVSWTTWP